MGSYLEKIKKMDNIKKWFYGLMIVGMFASLISILVTNGESFKAILIHDESNMAMDFFNSIYNSRNGDPYATLSNYPPLANLFYYFLNLIIPKEAMGGDNYNLRINQIAFLLHSIYIAITFSSFTLIVHRFKRGINLEKILFLCIILFSTPFIFTLERGNILFVALLFSMGFIFLKDSKIRTLREFSYICLAIAAAIKIYPALFGLLLLQEKRYKDALKTVIYGVAFFFLPFVFFNGIADIKIFLRGIMASVNLADGLGFGYRLDVGNTVGLIGYFFNNLQHYMSEIGGYISIFVFVIGVTGLFFIKTNWKRIALLSLLMILVPGFSFVYMLIFMLPSLMLFLDSKDKRVTKDYVYISLFTLIFVPITYGGRDFFNFAVQSYFPLSISTVVQRFTIIIMFIMLIIEAVIAFIRQFKKNVMLNTAIAGVMGILLLGTTAACVIAALNI